MNLVNEFSIFLQNTVNLNQNRIDVAKTGIETVEKFLKNNDIFKKYFISVKPQGSYRQGTIIKPCMDNKDFDVDLLFQLKKVNGWEPKDYLAILHDEFFKTDRYKDIVDKRGKTRCVTLDYESDFHMDIIPCVDDAGNQKIMNKNTNQYEITDADGYAEWFSAKNSAAQNNLVKVVRLVKYLRDTKLMNVKSILLTTLLGQNVYVSDPVIIFSDVPTTLKNICNRVNDYLQRNPVMPTIVNPSLPSEDFNRHWDQEKYENFRDKFKLYTEKISDAYDDPDFESSVKKWTEIFGDDFLIAVKDAEKQLSETVFPLGDYQHLKVPEWPITNVGCSVKIKCTSSGYKLMEIPSNGPVQFDGNTFKYEAITLNEPAGSEIFWQVVNTGIEAKQDNGLRGGFFKGKDLYNKLTSNQKINHEKASYSGKHWIECFVVNRGRMVARSGPFHVNIINRRRFRFIKKR
ncbi:MAG: nucleotidyltransferase [Patescibacteria group bacterium]|jgi:hypothetical protein